MSGPLKPNGAPIGTYKISIDDGYCEWEAAYEFPVSMSIDQIRGGIEKHFGAKRVFGSNRLRTTHEPPEWKHFR